MLGAVYAIQAGLLASLASLFGKLSLNSDDVASLCSAYGKHINMYFNIGDTAQFCLEVTPIVRVFFFALIFVCNALMWVFFSKAMNASSTTGEAIAMNSAANFLFTAFTGVILFREKITYDWFVGTLLIILGVICIHMSTSQKIDKSKEKTS